MVFFGVLRFTHGTGGAVTHALKLIDGEFLPAAGDRLRPLGTDGPAFVVDHRVLDESGLPDVVTQVLQLDDAAARTLRVQLDEVGWVVLPSEEHETLVC